MGSDREPPMSETPRVGALDDRAQDSDMARRRDAAAHLIDIARRMVRVELDASIHLVTRRGRRPRLRLRLSPAHSPGSARARDADQDHRR